MQPVINDTPSLVPDAQSADESEYPAGASDTEAMIQQGGQAIEAQGNDLGHAASGARTDVDIDTARQRMRDCQSALVSLGYVLGDHDDPADAVSGTADQATREAIAQFQDDNDLDITGVIDRDTYEGILRGFEQAMSMREHSQPDDDFMPMQPGRAVQQTAEADAEDDIDDARLIDDSDEALLTMRDDMRNGEQPGLPTEDF